MFIMLSQCWPSGDDSEWAWELSETEMVQTSGGVDDSHSERCRMAGASECSLDVNHRRVLSEEQLCKSDQVGVLD